MSLILPAGTATDFATGIDTPVDLDVGPDGALYYRCSEVPVDRSSESATLPAAGIKYFRPFRR